MNSICKHIILLMVALCLAVTGGYSQCAPCDNPTSFDVDLSANPDTVWTISSTRNGLCCGATSTRCIRFNVTTHPQTNEISFQVANPAPPGGAFYQVNCGAPTSLGTPLCVSGQTSFCIVFCKSGGDSPNYTISAARTFAASPDITLSEGCEGSMTVAGLQESTIIWNSISPGAMGDYNNYLSCTTGCDSVSINAPIPSSLIPPYSIDFMVSGTASGCASGTSADTVTVNFVDGKTVTITPPNPAVCAGAMDAAITANGSGGAPPYSYLWSTGDTTSTVNVGVGTYWVQLSDTSSSCPFVADTVTVIEHAANITASAGPDQTVCENNPDVQLQGSFTVATGAVWTGGTGTFSTDSTDTVAVYTPSAAEIAAGTLTLTLTTTGNGGCTAQSDQVTITIVPEPLTTAGNNGPVCEGDVINLTATTVSGATYSWAGPNGFTSSQQNPSISGAVATHAGTYSVTASVGGCTGTASTTDVVVSTTPAAPTATANSPLCAGTTLNLSASAIAGATYSWTGPNGFTSSQQNPSIPAITSVGAGTYQVTAAIGSCVGPPGNVSVTVNPLPAAPGAGSNSPVCEGRQLDLTAGTITGATYSWTGPNGFTSSLQNPSIVGMTTAEAGSYSVSATVNGCSGPSSAVNVAVNTTPATPVAGSNSPVCEGNTLSLTASNVAGATYVWAGPNGFISTLQNPGINGTTIANEGTYYVSTVLGSCPSDPDSVVVDIVPKVPAPIATANSPVCEGASLNLFADTINGAAYSWTGPNGFTSSQRNPVVAGVSAADAGTYSVTATVSGCTGPSSDVAVSVIPTPAAPTASGTTICEGTTAILSATAPGGTYQWYDAASGGALLHTGANFTTPVLSVSTTYYVQTTISGCPGPRTAVTVTVTPLPAAPTVSGATICENSSTTLSATAPGGTYEWYDAPTGGSLLATGANYNTPVLTADTSFYVQTTVSGCAGPRSTATVTITPADDSSFTYTSATFCPTSVDPAAIIPGGTPGTFSASPAGLVFLNTSTGEIDVSASALNTYTVTFTTSGPCPTSSSIGITITNAPDASISYSGPYCENTGTAAPVFGAGASAGIFSTATPGVLFINANTGVIDLNASAPGTYKVYNTILPSGGCPGDIDSATVTIEPSPVVEAGVAQTICEGTSVTLAGSIGGSASSATWSAGGGTFTPDNSTLTAAYAPTASEVTAGSAKLYLTTDDPAGTCTAVTDSVTISITPLPAAPTAAGATICENDSAELLATAPGGSYEWYDAATGGNLLASSASFTTPVLTAGTTYYVQTTVSGCTGARTAVNVQVDPTPAVPTVNDATICEGETASLTATAPGGTYEWYDAATGGTLLFTGATYTTPALFAGKKYYVQSIISGCPGPRKEVTVTVNPIPASPTALDAQICINASATLTATAPGGSYEWYDLPAGGIQLATGSSFTTGSIAVDTAFYVQTTVSGCTGPRTQVNVTVAPVPAAPTVSNATICEGNTATLTATAPGGTYAWYDAATGGNLLAAGASYATPILSATTTYYVQTTVSGCTGPRASVDVIVTPLPPEPTAQGTAICDGETATLTATAPGGTYEWYDAATGGNLLATSASYTTPVLSANTSYYVQTTVSGCTGPRLAVLVTVNPIPVAPTVQPVTICEGNVATLTATAPGGQFEWYDAATGGNLLATSSSYTSGTLTNDTSFYVQTNIAGCTSTRVQANVTVTPTPPTPTATTPVICAGKTAMLTATSPGGQYYWYLAPAGGSSVGTGNTYTTSALTVNTTFYLETEISGCRSNRGSVTVNVTPLPAAPTVTGKTICEGTTAVLTATAPGGSYEWFDVPTGGTVIDTGSAFTTPALSDTITYYVQTTLNGCTGSRSPATVNVVPTDDPSFTYSSGTYCLSGSDPSANISGTTGSFTSSPAGLVFLNTFDGTIDLSASALGTYTLTYTTDGMCPASIDMMITVTDTPDASFIYNDPFCELAGTASPVFPVGASSGIFSSSSPDLVFDNPVSGVIDLDGSKAGTYTVVNTIAASGGCVAVADSQQVTIEPAAIVDAGADQTVCAGEIVQLQGSIGGSAASAQWSNGTGTFSPGPATLLATYTPTAAENSNGKVMLHLTTDDPSGVCASRSDSMTITINPIPAAPTASGATICEGTSTSLTATAPGGTYRWYNASTGGNLLYTGSTYLTPALSVQTTYYVGTTINGCAGPRQAVTVNIIPSDDPSFTYSSGTYCVTGTDPTAIITGGFPGSFSASPAGITFLDVNNGKIDVSASATGTYTISYTTTGPCPAVSSMQLTISGAPEAAFSYSGSYCQFTANPLPVFDPGASAGVFSSGDPGIVFTNNSTGEVDLQSSAAGTYTVVNTIAAAGGCAADIDSASITIELAAIVNAGADTSICAGDTVSLKGSISGSATTAVWTAGGGAFDPGSSSLLATYVPSASETAAGMATIRLTTNDPAGVCPSATDQLQVSILKDDPTFTYPSGTYCVSGANAIAIISGSKPGTFTATPAGLVFADTVTGEIDVSASALGTYMVTYTTSGSCPASSSMNITITDSPVAGFGYSDPFCNNGGTVLPTFDPGSSAGIFSSSPSGTIFLNPASGEIDLAKSTAGTYTIYNRIPASGGCVEVIDSATITIEQAPLVDAGTDQVICADDPVQLNGNISGSASMATWIGTGVFGPDNTTLNATYMPSGAEKQAGFAKLYLETDDPAGVCGPAMDSIVITINDNTNVPAVKHDTVCVGSTALLTASGQGTAFEWHGDTSGTAILHTGSSFVTPTINRDTVFYVRSIANGCPGPFATARVTIVPADDPSFTYSSGTYCISGTDPSANITGLPGGTFGFSPAGLAMIDNLTGLIDVSASALGTYEITYTTKGTCPRSSTISITITNKPDASFSYNGPFCSSDANALPVFGTGASAGVFSSLSAGLVLADTVTGEIAIDQSTPGSYDVVNHIAASGGCAAASDTQTVVIDPAPVADAGKDTSVCANTAVMLNGSIGGVATFASWSGGNGTFTPDSSALNAIYMHTASEMTNGSVSLVLTTDDPSGACLPASDTVEIAIISDKPAFSYASGTYCVNGTDPVPVISNGAPGSFKASPQGLVFADTVSGKIDVSASTAGTYEITFTTSANCKDSSSATLTITDKPDPAFTYASPVCEGSANLLPQFSASASAGVFTASPAGLTFVDKTTGEVDMSATQPGTYTVVNTIGGQGGCALVSDTVNLVVEPAAAVDAGNDQVVCKGSPAILQGAIGGSATNAVWSGGAGTWSPNTAALSVAYTPTTSEEQSGFVLLTLTTDDPAGSCPAVEDQVLVSIDEPIIANAGNDTSICGVDVVELNGSYSGTATSFTWSGGIGTFSPTNNALDASYTPHVTEADSGSVTLKLTVSKPGGACPADNDEMVITINQDDPSFTYSSGTFCNTGTDPVATVKGGVSGIFSATPAGLSITDAATGEIDVSASVLGTYKVTYVTTGLCPDSSSMNVTITDNPDATFAFDNSYCRSGDNPEPQFTGGASAGVFTSSPGGLNFVSQATGEIELSATTPGTYLITNTIAPSGGCAGSIDSGYVTIQPAATVNAGVDQAICEGSAVKLDATIGGAATSASWSGGAGAFTPNAGITTATYTPAESEVANGSVLLTIKTNDPNGVCPAATDQLLITINQLPEVDAGQDQTICGASAINLVGFSNTGSGRWSATGGTGTFAPGDSALSVSYTPTTADTAKGSLDFVLISTGNGACPATSDVVKAVFIPAITVDAGADQSVCSNSVIELTGVVSPNNAGYWTSTGSGQFAPDDSSLNTFYIPDSAETGVTKIALVSLNNSSCPAVSDTLEVTIAGAPVVDAGNAINLCKGTMQVQLNGQVSGPTTTGRWTTTGTGTFTPDDSTLNAVYQLSSADTAAGSVALALGSTNNGTCTPVYDTVRISVSDIPLVNAGEDTTVCADVQTIQLNGNISGTTNTGYWSTPDGAGNFTPDSSRLNAVYNIAAGDITAGSIRLVLSAQPSCKPVMDTLLLSFSQLTTVNAGADISVCGVEEVTLSGTATGNAEVQWSTPDGTGVITNDTARSTTYQPSQADLAAGQVTFVLTVAGNNSCGSATDSVLLTLGQLPVADFTTTGNEFSTNTDIQFTDQSSDAVKWEWDFGDGIGTDSMQHPSYAYTVEGEYVVTLVAYTASGCSDTATMTLNISGDKVVAVPTGFSPNGDQFNDVLYVRGGPFTEVDFRIYNEWGNEIFVTTDPSKGWDGTYKGEAQPAGTYTYVLKGRTETGEEISKFGDVTLIR